MAVLAACAVVVRPFGCSATRRTLKFSFAGLPTPATCPMNGTECKSTRGSTLTDKSTLHSYMYVVGSMAPPIGSLAWETLLWDGERKFVATMYRLAPELE